MNIRRIEAGILDSGSDFEIKMNLFEAGLEKFVDLTKKEFIGQQALSLFSEGKVVFGVLSKGMIPKGGNSLLYNGKCVGTVTTGAASPFLGMVVGYAKFIHTGRWASKILTLRSHKDKET